MTKAKDEHLMSQKIRILFNDSHANVKPELTHHQGGATSFAVSFTNYFEKKYKDVELVSILFSDNQIDKKIYLRHTKPNKRIKRDVFEVVYPKEFVTRKYKMDFTKGDLVKELSPLLDQINLAFEKINPDLVFLNGFNISNWMIMKIAHERNIPVCIQHAGVWKKEIYAGSNSFSSDIKRIFNSMEKETLKKTTHQIFLNDTSRKTFFAMHSVDKKYIKKTSIIPLPAEPMKTIPVTFKPKEKYNFGMVARWDGVKNHDAIYRLTQYFRRHKLPHTINVVTQFPNTPPSAFRKKYEQAVTIVPPMDQQKLKQFYASQDIIIIPSRFETGPFVLIEALMCGKTVLLSQNTGWADDYRHYDLSDMIFSPRDSGEKIFSLVKKLEAKPSYYTQRFNTLQKKIKEECAPQKVFEEYYKIFTKLTTQNNG